MESRMLRRAGCILGTTAGLINIFQKKYQLTKREISNCLMGQVSKKVCKPLRCDTESRMPVGVSSDDINDSSGGTRYCLDTGVKRAISPVSPLHAGGKQRNTAAL